MSSSSMTNHIIFIDLSEKITVPISLQNKTPQTTNPHVITTTKDPATPPQLVIKSQPEVVPFTQTPAHTVQDADDINPQNTRFTELANFFSIKDPVYFKSALYDALGLYSLIKWKNDIYTYDIDNRNGAFYTTDNSQKNTDSSTGKLLNANSTINSIYTNEKYLVCGTFLKSYNTNFKCTIFKHISRSEYIVCFKWGSRENLYEPAYDEVFEKMYKFIIKTITESDANVLLIGFSMGASIAQHIAFKFIDNKSKINVYMVSLGIGGSLTTEQKHKLESELAGKYISLGLMISYKPPDFTEKESDGGIVNSTIYPDKGKNTTIKTLMIDFGLKQHCAPDADKYMIKVYKETFILKGFTDYDTLGDRNYVTELASKPEKIMLMLHEYTYYRQLLLMILQDKEVDEITGLDKFLGWINYKVDIPD